VFFALSRARLRNRPPARPSLVASTRRKPGLLRVFDSMVVRSTRASTTSEAVSYFSAAWCPSLGNAGAQRDLPPIYPSDVGRGVKRCGGMAMNALAGF